MTSTITTNDPTGATDSATDAADQPGPVTRSRSIARVTADTLGHPFELDRQSAARHGRDLLDHVLADLADLDVTPPQPVRQVLDLWARTTEHLAGRRTFGEWLADQDLADLTPQGIAAAMRETRTARDTELVAEVEADMLDRALDALADAADDITLRLRAVFDPPARTVADAVAAGVTAELRAEVAIGDDALVTHWRSFMAAVPALGRIHASYYRLLLVAGFAMAPGERALSSGADWMAASAHGPVELVLPTERHVPAADPWLIGTGQHARSGTAADMQAERQAGFETARQEQGRQLDDLSGRVREWMGHPGVVMPDPAGAPESESVAIPLVGS